MTNVIDNSDRNHPEHLSKLEGEVKYSCLNTNPNGKTLTLRIDSYDKDIWIRGEHRIDIGEKVILYYSNRNSSVLEASAYDILFEDGKVKYRYAGQHTEFRILEQMNEG